MTLCLAQINMDDRGATGEIEGILDALSRQGVGSDIPVTELSETSSDSILEVLRFLDLFGVIELTRGQEGEYTLSIEYPQQYYFIQSLSQYQENDLTVFRAWDEGRKDEVDSTNLFYGTQFLHYLERERVNEVADPQAFRNETVVKAIVKADVGYYKQPRYLFEYHRKSEQYKLLGGLVEDSDSSRRKALEREINEELPDEHLELGDDFLLNHVDAFEQEVVSFTYGAFSRYDVHYYLLDLDESIDNIDTGSFGEWLTLDEIQAGQTRDDKEVYPLEPEVVSLMQRQPTSNKIVSTVDPLHLLYEYRREIVEIATIISLLIAIVGLGLKFI